MAKAVRAMAAVVIGVLLLGSGVADATAPAKKRKPRATTTTIATREDTSTLRSTLTVSACHLELDDQAKLAPLATSNVGTIKFTGGTVTSVELPDPVPISITENGNRVTCSYQSGSDANASEDLVVIDAVDFPGSKGVDAAKRAYATVKAAYQPGKLGAAGAADPPDDLTGLGDEAFVATRDDGNAQAFVTRQGEILVRVDASQSSSSVGAPLDFDAVKAATAIVLAQAVAQVPTSGSSSSSSTTTGANPKGNTGTGQITTTGAVNATWKIRIADLGISEGCGIIPLITTDGKITGSINTTTLGFVTFESSTLSQSLKGKGGTIELPTDSEGLDPYHVTFNATVKDQYTGKKKTTIKGSFDFTCAPT
jgi:hypothetical protein